MTGDEAILVVGMLAGNLTQFLDDEDLIPNSGLESLNKGRVYTRGKKKQSISLCRLKRDEGGVTIHFALGVEWTRER